MIVALSTFFWQLVHFWSIGVFSRHDFGGFCPFIRYNPSNRGTLCRHRPCSPSSGWLQPDGLDIRGAAAELKWCECDDVIGRPRFV